MAAVGGGFKPHLAFSFILLLSLWHIVLSGEENDQKSDDRWKKKDVRDYTDADIERLFDQWEVSFGSFRLTWS